MRPLIHIVEKWFDKYHARSWQDKDKKNWKDKVPGAWPGKKVCGICFSAQNFASKVCYRFQVLYFQQQKKEETLGIT